MLTRPIFFMHIPKTSGTSVRMALEALYRPHEILPDAAMMERQGGKYPPAPIVATTLRYQAPSVKLVRGHYHFCMSEMMSAPIIVSLLREPVARAISHIKHRARGADVALYLAALNEGRLPVPDNVMTRFLGGTVEPMLAGHNHLDFRDREIANRAALLESALERLELITCLGLVERMDLFAESLRAQGICIEIGRENVVPVEMDLDDAQIATIRAHNDLDIQLYQAAQAKLTH